MMPASVFSTGMTAFAMLMVMMIAADIGVIAKAAGKEEPAPLALGEYKEVDSYDATRCYQVVDENSKTTFDVTFYLYGDVVSGWDVAVADKASTNKK